MTSLGDMSKDPFLALAHYKKLIIGNELIKIDGGHRKGIFLNMTGGEVTIVDKEAICTRCLEPLGIPTDSFPPQCSIVSVVFLLFY